jgi:hypothetical protein
MVLVTELTVLWDITSHNEHLALEALSQPEEEDNQGQSWTKVVAKKKMTSITKYKGSGKIPENKDEKERSKEDTSERTIFR